MSERRKPHNGRDRDGHFKVRQVDVDETMEDPKGEEYLRDDVRLGGAVADIGAHAGASGERIERLIENNRADVDPLVGRDREGAKGAKGRARRRRKG